MDRVLRNSKKSSILACGNTHESVSMKALSEFDNLFSLTSYFTTEEICKEFLAQQRWGYVRAIIVSKTDRATLQPIIGQFVEEGSHVITDELSAYKGLEQLGYGHSVVAHGAEEYANGDVFTNGIEGFWCHFRRMIDGCYHNVSDEHLQAYIDEACYRWNTRKASQSERFCDMFNKSI